MPDNQVPPDGAAPPAGNNGDNAADAAGQVNTEEWRNPAEIKKSLQGQRDLTKRFDRVESVVETIAKQVADLLPKAKETPSNGAGGPDMSAMMGRLDKMERDLLFERALSSKTQAGGTALAGRQVQILRGLFDQEKPSDVGEWLESTIPLFSSAKPSTAASPAASPAAASPPPKAKSTDTGPGGVDLRQTLGTDLMTMDPDVFKNLSSDEKRKLYEGYKRERGMDYNFFAAAKSKK